MGGAVTGKFVPSPCDSQRCSRTLLSLETQVENSIYRLSISGNYRQSERQATMKTSVKFREFANYTEAGVTIKLSKFIKVLALEESINFRQLIFLSCKPRTVRPVGNNRRLLIPKTWLFTSGWRQSIVTRNKLTRGGTLGIYALF